MKEQLSKLSDLEKNVLILRYVSNMKWSEIATLLDYDEKYLLKLHKNSLECLIKNKE